MNMEQLLAEVEHLDETALERLKERIAQREIELRLQQRPHTVEEWAAVSQALLNDFWADTDADEKAAILDAIREKNKPPKKDR